VSVSHSYTTKKTTAHQIVTRDQDNKKAGRGEGEESHKRDHAIAPYVGGEEEKKRRDSR